MHLRLIRVLSALALLMLGCATPVFAHPHSFITLKTQIIEKDGQMTGLQMRWLMDEITSADLLYDAGDARPGSEIWKKSRFCPCRLLTGWRGKGTRRC